MNIKIKLDEELIEFGTAIDDGDLDRALDYLESLPSGHLGAAAMWAKLAEYALEAQKLYIAIRCYGELNDISKVRYLQKIELTVIDHQQETGEDGINSLKAQAMLAQLRLAYLMK